MARDVDEGELNEAFALIAKARAFWERNAASLSRSYQNQWVAVKSDKVVASAPDPENLLDQLEEKGLDPSSVLIRFVPGPEVEFAF